MSKVRSALMALTAMVALDVGSAEAGGPRSIKDDPIIGGINWSGFYAGIQGGYGWGDTEHTVVTGTSGEFDANGGLIGVTWGTNRQRGDWVYGFESDFSFSSMDGASGGGHFTELRNLGTARLRLGYAAGTSLMYVTGGLAYGEVKGSGKGLFVDDSERRTHFGWALGAGIEWAFAPRWSLKAEYLHVDLGDRQSYSSPFFGDIDVHLTADIARIGVNYSFGPDFWSGVLGGR